MKEKITEGTICLKDDYGIEYKIAKITYELREDESFRYVFRPYYEVIDMLNADLFQGIPGMKIESHKKEYIRENIIPTFISERAPAKNRENLWEMLYSVGMTYLNQLEWLIRTDTQYFGDRMYVKRYSDTDEKHTVTLDNNKERMLDSTRKLLDIICYGNDVTTDDFEINDSNRKDIYHMLYGIYKSEMDIRRQRISSGIREGVKNGHFKGRKKISVSTPKLYEIRDALADHRITEKEALEKLNISRATLYRRLKELGD